MPGITQKHTIRSLQAIENLKTVLKPHSGSVIVRDYATGDLAQQRLACEGRHKRLAPDFYVRGDGTRCLYFSKVSFSNSRFSTSLCYDRCFTLHIWALVQPFRCMVGSWGRLGPWEATCLAKSDYITA
jgi:hypothetical protein